MIKINEKNNFPQTLFPINIENAKTHDMKAFDIKEVDGHFVFALEANFDKVEFKVALKNFIKTNKKNINVDVNSFGLYSPSNPEDIIYLLVDVIEEFSTPGFSMKTVNKPPEFTYNLLVNDTNMNFVANALSVATTKTFVRRLQEAPSNIITPETFVDKVKEQFVGPKSTLKMKVIDTATLEKKGMNLIIGVGKGGKTPPRMLVLEYTGTNRSAHKIALVGKGVCFDTGGINLKPSTHINNMKYDMSGAAIVAGAIHCLSLMKSPNSVVALMPLVENTIDKWAQRPDDVVTSYNGKTVEIGNTDAEGRLIMADAITYAIRDAEATRVIDLSTLTGAMSIALGESFTGVWATEDEDYKHLLEASQKVAEPIWRMPFHKDFRKYLDTPMADICNISINGGGGKGSSAQAAEFLKEFIENNIPYIHIDIAGTASVENRCTSVMLKTLVEFCRTNS